MNLLLMVFGIFGGILGGMGMGGGTLLIPLLTIFAGFEQHLAQSINLFVFIPLAIVSLLIHTKNNLIDYKKGLIILIPACFTAILSSLLATKTSAEDLQVYFSIFLIVLGVFQIISVFFDKKLKK